MILELRQLIMRIQRVYVYLCRPMASSMLPHRIVEITVGLMLTCMPAFTMVVRRQEFPSPHFGYSSGQNFLLFLQKSR